MVTVVFCFGELEHQGVCSSKGGVEGVTSGDSDVRDTRSPCQPPFPSRHVGRDGTKTPGFFGNRGMYESFGPDLTRVDLTALCSEGFWSRLWSLLSPVLLRNQVYLSFSTRSLFPSPPQPGRCYPSRRLRSVSTTRSGRHGSSRYLGRFVPPRMTVRDHSTLRSVSPARVPRLPGLTRGVRIESDPVSSTAPVHTSSHKRGFGDFHSSGSDRGWDRTSGRVGLDEGPEGGVSETLRLRVTCLGVSR